MKSMNQRNLLWLLGAAALSVPALLAASRPEGPWPYALLMGVSFLLAAFGKRKQPQLASGFAPVSEGQVPAVRFADVAANEEALESLRDLVNLLRCPEDYRRLGARAPRGVLLYGAPGTGKTLMARALAGEAGVPFFAVNGADFVEMYVGVGASRVRALFGKARKAGRAVIFFDEIDAIGKKRDNRNDEREQTLNALLTEMSGFDENSGIMVVAATNRADTLDEALLRAGRFDRQIEVPLPDYAQRLAILRVHARGKPLAENVCLENMARQTALFSGAKLDCLMNEAAICAAKRGGRTIEEADLQKAMDQTLFGREKPRPEERRHERRVTAAHEAGHAVVTAVLLPENAIQKVSIIPTSRGAAGYSMALPPEKDFHERRELLAHLATALAGREAERLLLGAERVSTGAANDIEKAAVLARRMVCEWGMLPFSDEVYLASSAQREAAQQQWLAEGRKLAACVLAQHQPVWERLTRLLETEEAVDGAAVAACFTAQE